MRKYFTHLGTFLSVIAAALLSIGCGGKEDTGDEGAGDGGNDKAPKKEQSAKGPDKAPSKKGPDKSGDLESQMVGYWAPNVESMTEMMKKEVGDDPNAAAMIPMMVQMMGMMSIEFQKGSVTMHGPQGAESSTYELTNTDQAAKTLTMNVTQDGSTEEGQAQLNGDQLHLKKGEDTLILERITEAQFKERQEGAKAAGAALGGAAGAIIGGEEGAPTPPRPPVPVPGQNP